MNALHDAPDARQAAIRLEDDDLDDDFEDEDEFEDEDDEGDEEEEDDDTETWQVRGGCAF